MENTKKNVSFVKVGGRRVIKKNNSSHTVFREILDKNKEIFGKSIVDDLSIERNSKIYKYKNNIRIVFDNQKKPIGFIVSGFPDVKNKIVTDPPINFEKAVEELNKEIMTDLDDLETYIGIE